MEYKVNGEGLLFCKKIRDNDRLRSSFDELAQKTFGLSFADWYLAGFWTDKYQPYTLLNGEKVVSNASINIIDTMWEGVPKRYIQIGTVMTAVEYRNMGLSKFLLNRIFDDWQKYCDAIYLYANDSVVDFYPKFGFIKANEYQMKLMAKARISNIKRLDMSSESDISLLHNYYQKSNPFSELPMIDNWGLLMFYCSAFMKNCVYFVEDVKAVVIAEQEQDMLKVYDVYCEESVILADVINAVVGAHSACNQVCLGFGLKNANSNELSLLREENTTLFVLQEKENIFKTHKTMFPLLSHA